MAQKGLKKEIKRAKIELKDDVSIDSKTPTNMFDKNILENKEPFISLDDFKKILTSNKTVGDAISSIFQVQLDFAHILADIISEIGINRKEEKDKSITTNADISSNFESAKYGKGLFASYFKLERIERDITSLLGLNRHEKANSNKSSFIKSTRTSPPLSARVWESTIKRSSVPQLLTEPKSRVHTEDSTPKNNNSLPLQGFNEKSPPTNSKVNTSLHLSLNKINKNSPKKSPNITLPESSKLLSSKMLSPQNTKIKSSVSPQRKIETFSSNPASHRDLRPDKTLFSEYLLPPKNTKNPAYMSMDDAKVSASKTHQKTPSGQMKVPSLSLRDSHFERKLSTKPYMGELIQKDLGEDSPQMEITTDEKQMSRETANLMNETDKTCRTVDMEDKTQKITTADPTKQKMTIRELFREELAGYRGGFPKANEGDIHQKKFLIDAKWLRTWRDYVNFDVDDEYRNMLDMKTYSKPTKIINKVLLKNDLILDLGSMSADLELKDNLLEHHDFEAIPQKIFDQLAHWYGCDFEISRFLRPDPFRNNKLFLDLYPNKPGRNKQFDNAKPSDKNQLNYGNLNSDNKVIKEIISSNLVTNAFKKKK